LKLVGKLSYSRRQQQRGSVRHVATVEGASAATAVRQQQQQRA
jgi:hypothetical protein